MTSQDIKNLTENELNELMYAICRSGKIIVPQFFNRDHIKNLTGMEPTNELMIQIQDNFQCDWDLMEIIEEKVELFSKFVYV